MPAKFKRSFLYLASASPRRKEILLKLKIPFKVVRSSYSEESGREKNPKKLALTHAIGKAAKAKIPKTARWVLGADTVVYAAGKILGKPRDEKHAFEMLSILSGKTHHVYTAIVLLDGETRMAYPAVEETKVTFKKLSEKQIWNYIRRAHILDKAGSYGIQLKPKVVKKIRGSYTNVVGLPAEALVKLLRRSGFR